MALSSESIVQCLENLEIPLPAAEVHGLCCGLLCSMSSGGAKTRWFTEILDAASMAPEQVSKKASSIKGLDDWFSETLTAINDADMEFSPHMPDDSAPVQMRLNALSDFCGGFTYGVGIALSQRGERPLSEDVREIIEDFQSIEAVDPLDRESAVMGVFQPKQVARKKQNDEENEAIYFELLEYVRVGVLLVLEELRPVAKASQEIVS